MKDALPKENPDQQHPDQLPFDQQPSAGKLFAEQPSKGKLLDQQPSAEETFKKDPFDTVLGQSRPKNILRGALRRNTLASSYLFFGPPGCGKLALALALARSVNCLSEDSRPCGTCSQCQKILQLRHPDVTVLFPRPSKIKDEDLRRALEKLAANPYADISFSKSSRIHIDSVRDIRSQAVMRPYEGRKKIFILAEADRMTQEAANALLKTLEEPPGHVLMVLTTSRFGKLPSTVMSRCQKVRFNPLSAEEVSEGLKRLSPGDPESRRLASRLAQGDLRRAMGLLKEDIHQAREETSQLLSAALDQDLAALLRWSRKLGKANDRAESRRRLEALLVWYRDLMLLREGSDRGLVNTDLAARLSDLSSRYNWSGIQQCLGDIRESFRALDANVNQELLWITLLSRLKRHRKNTAS